MSKLLKDTTAENVDLKERLIKLENEDQKTDSQLLMCWFCLFSAELYPILIIICDFLCFEKALEKLADISDVFFLSVMGIVSVYFGSSAYTKKNDE